MNQRAFTYGLNDQLTIDDLRAYRAGQLSGATLHRVERILLENPFYADALDGLDALQQVGENLHSHTRDLHVALQGRVQETATPHRLMPLWVTSAAASIVLVICVAIYHFFYVIPANTNVPTADVIEPGTVLIDSKALGIGTTDSKSVTTSNTVAASPKLLPLGPSAKSPVMHRRQPTHVVVRQQPAPHPVETESTVKMYVFDRTPIDHDIMPLPISQADIQRRQMVETERAFER